MVFSPEWNHKKDLLICWLKCKYIWDIVGGGIIFQENKYPWIFRMRLFKMEEETEDQDLEEQCQEEEYQEEEIEDQEKEEEIDHKEEQYKEEEIEIKEEPNQEQEIEEQGADEQDDGTGGYSRLLDKKLNSRKERKRAKRRTIIN